MTPGSHNPGRLHNCDEGEMFSDRCACVGSTSWRLQGHQHERCQAVEEGYLRSPTRAASGAEDSADQTAGWLDFCQGAQELLNITVGTKSISPLIWSIESGSLITAKAMLEETRVPRFCEHPPPVTELASKSGELQCRTCS